jgi:two-component system response regulator ChvI
LWGAFAGLTWQFRGEPVAAGTALPLRVILVCIMASPLIWIVDDEEHIRETVSYALAKASYRVKTHADGAAAWEAFSTDEEPSAIILDVTMPGMDGLELCKKIRGHDSQVPILFLSSRDDEIDRILGLEIGGDDYVTKPFSLRELETRIRVILRRVGKAMPADQEISSTEALTRGPLTLDLDRFETLWNGDEVELTVTEFRIVHCLAEFPGHVKSREQLMERAYPETTFVHPRTIDTHIKRIRRKFHALDPSFDALGTVHGVGYRLAL